MGKALPMFSSFRNLVPLWVFCLVVTLASLEASVAQARSSVTTPQASSVEVYGEGPLGSSAQTGVMPDGMTWNRPLKAGEMVLPRKGKSTKETTQAQPARPAVPRMPVGEVKPPQLSKTLDSRTTPPQIASDRNSTTSVMMLQGMKNALQQSGQNPEIPKSSITPPQLPFAKGDAPVMVDMMAAEKPVSIKEELAPKIIHADKGEQNYQPGQEPKAFVLGKDGAAAKEPAALNLPEIVEPPKGEETYKDVLDETNLFGGSEAPAAAAKSEIVFPPEMANTAAKPAAKTSIFGAPVDDKASAQETVIDLNEMTAPAPAIQEAAPAKAAEVATEAKKPSKSFWSRLWGSDDEAKPAPAPTTAKADGPQESVIDLGAADEPQDQMAPQQAFADEPAAAEPAYTPAAVPSSSPDGSCGPANGLASAQKPASGDLCQSGTASSVVGSGPWRWSCKGREGGMTVSCAAPVATQSEAQASKSRAAEETTAAANHAEDGVCGAAHNQGAENAPVKGLCAKGAASRVNGAGPWTWACSGSNGGQAAACVAPLKTDGVCGRASSDGADYMPSQDLCAAGLASAVTGSGPWNWTCSGIHGGEAVTCSAQPKQNAICGAASLTGHESAPTAKLCSAGTPSALSGEGPWSWNCTGSHGGASVSCSAPKLADGICGSAHGSTYEKTPNEGLCASGRASRVTGLGPWSWSCMGVDGGQTVSCAASLGSKEAVASVMRCGAAAETLAFGKPDDRLCETGTASAVTGNGPWSWTCSDDAGHQTSCTTLSPNDGVCGSAAHAATSQEPRSGLCTAGTPTGVKANRGEGTWNWECKGSLGGSAKACAAPMGKAALESTLPLKSSTPSLAADVPAKCGASAGRSFESMPSDDLCLAGKATQVRGTGPLKWTCEANKGKVKVMCEADKMADGLCGPVNGSIQKTAPRSDLCAGGEATEVTGSGPWMWSCVGSGGGVSVSCSAASQTQTKVDGTCGAAANAVMPAAPTANLCDSGVASAVNGNGPWTWTCSGLNGGIASTCTTSKVLPKAPPPPGPAENGVCGPSNGVAFDEKPSEGLCVGGLASDVSGNGPWNWSCIGVNSGMTVSCTAPLTPPPPIVGMCGASSGVPTLTVPKASLCAAGIASAVSGQGPWTWSCSGTNGGSAVSCVAPKAGGSAIGTPSLTTPSLGGEAPAPKASPVGLVTPTLPSPSLQPMKPGTVPNLKPSKPLSQKMQPASGSATGGEVQDLAAMTPVKGRHGLDSEASTIGFMIGSDKLSKEAEESLNKVVAYMLANPKARLTMAAYSTTDGKISPRQARKISMNRALAARDYLASKGIDSSRVDVKPLGANVPSGDMDRIDILVN